MAQQSLSPEFLTTAETIQKGHPDVSHEVQATIDYVLQSELPSEQAVRIGFELLELTLTHATPRLPAYDGGDGAYAELTFYGYVHPSRLDCTDN